MQRQHQREYLESFLEHLISADINDILDSRLSVNIRFP
jgi:hypothetical protein